MPNAWVYGGSGTVIAQVAFYGYDVNSSMRQVSGGNTILTAADRSTVVLLGVTSLIRTG